MASPFDILGIDSDADEDEIVDAYRQRVKEAHPDQGGSKAEFQAVKTAYEQLKDGDRPYKPVPDPSSDVTQPRDADEDEDDERTVEYLNYEVLSDHGWSLHDPDLFENAADAELDDSAYGTFTIESTEPLLEAAENNGLSWPFACRGGACTNCAVAVVEGEMPSPAGHILPPELVEEGIRLSCITAPVSTDTKVVYNIKHLPAVNELLLPASRFEQASSR